MPSGRVAGEVYDLELPLDPLRETPHAVNDSGPGGGKPPPSALPKMRYVCYLVGAEQEAPGNRNVCQGGGSEKKAAGGKGSSGNHGGNNPGLLQAHVRPTSGL